jgi:Tfp pilus assembly PilM family ATPase
MADFLALDWEPGRLFAIDAQTQIGGIRVRHAAELIWPTEMDPQADTQSAGKWLKSALRDAGFSATQVLLSLPREDVVVRQLDLPDAPANEVPDMVRLQAATKSTVPLDQLLLDYLPLPSDTDSDGQQVLMTTVPEAQIAPVKQILEAAGLELMSIGISPVFVAELAMRAQRQMEGSADHLSLLVSRHNQRVEISMMRQGHLLFSHSTQVHGGDASSDDRAIVAEINRARLSLQGILEGTEIARVWVLGAENETAGLCDLIRERLECDVQPLDPFDSIDAKGKALADLEQRSGFSSPIGMLLSHGGGAIPSVDFLNPRRKQIPRDTRKLKAALAAAAVFLVAATGYGWYWNALAGLDAQIESARKIHAKLNTTIQQGQPTLQAAAQVDDWNRHNINWLDTMTQFNHLFTNLNRDGSAEDGRATRNSHRIYLTELHFSASGQTSQGQIKAKGFSKLDDDVNQLRDDLSDQNYRVSPPKIGWSRSDPGGYFRTLDMDFEIGNMAGFQSGPASRRSGVPIARRR